MRFAFVVVTGVLFMLISHVLFYSFLILVEEETNFGNRYFKRRAEGFLLPLFSIAFLILFSINNFNKWKILHSYCLAELITARLS